MGKQKLAVGAEVDLVTPGDLDKSVGRLERAMRSAPDKLNVTQILTADGSGNIGGGKDGAGLTIYETPAGRRADILRVSLSSQAYTPAAPLTTGWLQLCRNSGTNPPEQFFPGAGTTVLPAIYTDGEAAVRLGEGESYVAVGAGLPNGVIITVALLVRLWDDVLRHPNEPSR